MMNKKINQMKIDDLTKSRENFLEYSKGIKKRFGGGPSEYFYLKLMDLRKKEKLESLLNNNNFIELLYCTLACWGMNRMDSNTRMAPFEDFKENILKNKEKIKEFEDLELKDIKIKDKHEKLREIFQNLHVMQRDNAPKFVSNSKILHFLVPRLFPPMDNGHVLYFFFGEDKKTKKGKIRKAYPNIKGQEFEFFERILIESQKIATKLGLSKEDLVNEWDTSIPKLIDNVIIGYNVSLSKRKDAEEE